MNKDLERVKDAASIEEVVGETVQLKPRGANLLGLCPFHNEKTPSFTVSPSRQTFKCFGCGKGGDVITFVKERDGLDFWESVKLLGRKYNVEIGDATPEERLQVSRTTQLYAALNAAQQAFEKERKTAAHYWKSRGFTDETIADFNVSFASNDAIKNLALNNDTKRAVGLVNEKGNPLFYNRYMIPIYNTMGHLVAFSGRAIGYENATKYINSPQTEIYNKSAILFNLNCARRYIQAQNEVFITEGFSDVMMAWQCGIRNIVATCGTSITEKHVSELKRIGKTGLMRVNIAFNGDAPGQKATLRAIPMLVKAGFSVKVVKLPQGKDLLDVHNEGGKQGKEILTQTMSTFTDGVLMLIDDEQKRFNPQTPVEVSELQNRIAKIIGSIPDDAARQTYTNICIGQWQLPAFAGMVAQHVPKPPTAEPEATQRVSDTPVIPDFPIHVFPEKMKAIIADCEKWLSYPSTVFAMGLLGAASIAIGRKVRVQYIWDEGTVLYLLMVAPPGSNKTHPIKFALRPLMLRDKKRDKEFEQKRTQLLMTAAQDGEQPNLNKLRMKQTLFSDYTIEALGEGLAQNPEGVGVYMDELKGWIGNFERYTKGSEQEFWLSNASGGDMVTNRAKRKMYIVNSNITVIGTIQNGLLDEMSKGGRGLSGFIERFCFNIPEKMPVMLLKKRSERASDAHGSLFARYMPILGNLMDLEMTADEDGEAAPHILWFDEDAEDFLTDWANAQKETGDKNENEYIKNIYSKIQSQAIRFCLILAMLDWACAYKTNGDDNDIWGDFDPNNLRIKMGTVERGIALAEYFLLNALKANAIINFASPIDKLPRNYRAFYRELPEEFETADAKKLAIRYDISEEKMFRLLKNQDGDKPFFRKIKHGKYEKNFY